MPSPYYPFKSLTGRGRLFFFPSRAKEAKKQKKKKTPDLRLTGIPLPHLADPASRRRKNSEYGIKLEGFVRVLKMRHIGKHYFTFFTKKLVRLSR